GLTNVRSPTNTLARLIHRLIDTPASWLAALGAEWDPIHGGEAKNRPPRGGHVGQGSSQVIEWGRLRPLGAKGQRLTAVFLGRISHPNRMGTARWVRNGSPRLGLSTLAC